MNATIITGANGFVASALVRKLIQLNRTVIAVINNNSDRIEKIINDNECYELIKIVRCSISDYHKLAELIDALGLECDYDYLFHFAWEGSAGPKRGDFELQMLNAKATCQLVNEASKLKVKRFICASSIMGYEAIAVHNSSTVTYPTLFYSIAKMTGDMMAKVSADSLHIEYCSVIISNIYGPGETSPRLINTSIRKILNNERCSFSSGEQLYDFIYIDDAAEGFYKISLQGKNRGVYYLGSKERRPLKEYLIDMGAVLNASELIGIGDLENIQTTSFSDDIFDMQLLYKDTDFEMKTSFCDGILKTKEWIENIEG